MVHTKISLSLLKRQSPNQHNSNSLVRRTIITILTFRISLNFERKKYLKMLCVFFSKHLEPKRRTNWERGDIPLASQ